MSYFDGPYMTMSFMNVPVDSSNFGTPFSIDATHAWYLSSSRSPTCSCVPLVLP